MDEIRKCITKDEMIDSYIIRKIVFIDEQKVTYEEEFDLLDKDFNVYNVYINNLPVATLRYLIKGRIAKIGRVAVLKAYRGQNIGHMMMEKVINEIFTSEVEEIIIDAQLQAIPFYQKLGFIAYGDIFLDANIEHRKMSLEKS